MKTIVVVAAAIVHGRKVLATQRGYGKWAGWWEFPGGKVEAGEIPVTALRRELREELALKVEVHSEVAVVDYDYPDFHLTMHLYHCTPLGEPTLLEHSAARWLAPDEMDTVRWLPADVGVIHKLEKLLAE